jgi:hypothetical protein
MTTTTSVTRPEFTLRKKATKQPILTLRPHVMERFLVSRPESVVLVLAKYKADYKSITGHQVSLTYEQEAQLFSYFGANDKGLWTSKYSALPASLARIRNCFQDGFLQRTVSNGLLDDLDIAEQFFDMLDATTKP